MDTKDKKQENKDKELFEEYNKAKQLFFDASTNLLKAYNRMISSGTTSPHISHGDVVSIEISGGFISIRGQFNSSDVQIGKFLDIKPCGPFNTVCTPMPQYGSNPYGASIEKFTTNQTKN